MIWCIAIGALLAFVLLIVEVGTGAGWWDPLGLIDRGK